MQGEDLTEPVERPRPGQRVWGWARDYVYVANRMVSGVLSRTTPEVLLDPPDGSRVPVLLIPGVYESWRFLQPLAEHLHRRGHPVHVLDQLGWNTGAIPEMAGIVQDHLRRLDLEDVIVVAHSKGGLIAKYAAADPSTLARIRRVIAINSPFSGSRYAYLFLLLPSVRVFAPRGALIRQLARDLAVNERISSLYSVFDPHIPESSLLPGAENVVLPGIGHFRPLADPRTLAVIDAILERELDGSE